MRIKLVFSSDKKIQLKKGFVKQIQSLIYKLMDESLSKWLHDKGYIYKKRRFKLFTFSSILEKGLYDKSTNKFIFPNTISFYISSPVTNILEEIARKFVGTEYCRLGNNKLTISEISILKPPMISGDVIKVSAITPITIRSTFENKYHTHSPLEKSFSVLLNKNVKKKWEALYNKSCPFELEIFPLFEDANKYKKVVQYGSNNDPRKTYIEGWTGTYLLKGDKEILKFAYDAGLGERNSQGFGMVEVVDN